MPRGGPVPGLYATGWIKRGPVGLIGHTKSDAMETIAHLVADAEAGRARRPAVDGDILDLLDERDVAYTTWDGWLALDAHERALGETHGTRASASRSCRATSRSTSRARSLIRS